MDVSIEDDLKNSNAWPWQWKSWPFYIVSNQLSDTVVEPLMVEKIEVMGEKGHGERGKKIAPMA